MEKNLLENSKMIRETDKELLPGQMEKNLLENSKMVRETDREL
ncbi:hypothetical protein N8Z03_00505 [Pelagibacteraceae bacterium]|nr:hypothetical protein [Pelagibacteraceae bacterium]